MRTIRFLAVLAVLTAIADAGGVNPAWIKHYTGPTQSRFNEAADSYLDTLTGNIYVVGAGELAGNPGGTDLVVMKYRSDGTRVWANGFSGNGASPYDMAEAVAVDSAGNVYIAGRANNEGFDDAAWAKYDSNGVEIWRRTSSWAGNDAAFDIAIGNAGDVYICGADSGYGILSGYMVTRINPASGDTLWRRSLVLDPDAFTRRNRDVHPDYFNYEYYEWDNAAVSIAASPDSGVTTTGQGLDSDRDLEWWTMKFRPNGDTIWTRTYHNPNTSYDDDDVAFDLAVAGNGDIYAVGFDYYERSNSQGYNFAVVRYNSAGTRLNWNSIDMAAEHGDDYAFSVTLDDSNPQNVYVTGTLENPLPLKEQVATMKFSNALTARWGSAGASLGGNNDDRGYSVCYCKGRVYVTGRIFDHIAVLGYTSANSTPKDTLWSYTYESDDTLDFGSTVCASDSDHVFVSGESEHTKNPPPWTDLYTARLRYGHPDMSVTSVVAPHGTYDHWDTLNPQVTVTNNGDVIPVFNAFMYIGLPYGDTVRVSDGPAPGQSAVISFDPWTAHPTGLVPLRCSLEVEGDTNVNNDFLSDTVQVLPIDVGCQQIVSPVGPIDSGMNAEPVARFKNFGNSTQTFPVWFRIETPGRAVGNGLRSSSTVQQLQIYEDCDTITLAAQDSTDFSFVIWPASPPGTYQMTAFTALTGDDGLSNDTASALLVVQPGPGVQNPENPLGIPREYSLGSPRPNPAAGRMLVSFALPLRSHILLQIYDASGARVRTLAAAEFAAGFHHASWDGTDERGLRVRQGTYFCRLQAPNCSRITKLVMSE